MLREILKGCWTFAPACLLLLQQSAIWFVKDRPNTVSSSLSPESFTLSTQSCFCLASSLASVKTVYGLLFLLVGLTKIRLGEMIRRTSILAHLSPPLNLTFHQATANTISRYASAIQTSTCTNIFE